MAELIGIAREFGTTAVVPAACMWYIVKKDKSHKEERDTRQGTDNEIRTMLVELVKSNTQAMVELKDLIKDVIKK